MTEKMIENRVNKLRELESERQELETRISAIKAEIQQDFDFKGITELHTKNYIIRYKDVISQRFDSSALKIEFPDVYSRYIKSTSYRRFSIA